MQGTIETDVLVVGAGPGGSAAAYHLARHGIDVTVIEKAAFPREKVCGDGLTPRSVKAIQDMGVDTDDPRFERVIGLRVHARGTTIQLPWPELTSFPPFGLVMPRDGFDHLLAQRAVEGGRAAARADRGDRAGLRRRVCSRRIRAHHRRARCRAAARSALATWSPPTAPRAGSASPPASAATPGRPLGIAARRYYRVDYHPGPWIESWLDLWDGDLLLPGYGWLFPVAGGRINLGAGLLNTFSNFKDVSAQQLFAAFARMLPPEWGIDEDTAEGRVLSGPLPMGMNRDARRRAGVAAGRRRRRGGEPVQRRGHRLRDRDRRRSPRSSSHEALVQRPARRSRCNTARCCATRYGGYFAIGRQFAKVIGKPAIMGRATAHLLPRRAIMAFALRAMANLSDGRDGDLQDRMLDLAIRVAKAA